MQKNLSKLMILSTMLLASAGLLNDCDISPPDIIQKSFSAPSDGYELMCKTQTQVFNINDLISLTFKAEGFSGGEVTYAGNGLNVTRFVHIDETMDCLIKIYRLIQTGISIALIAPLFSNFGYLWYR